MSKPIAILIDDEPDIRELLAISLKRAGMDCVQAGSYTEGLNLIAATSCDLCITDVRMPDGSGLDLVRRFKAAHPNTPIAVMTAFDTTDIAVEAMKSGAFDFLAKPIRAKRLESLLEDIKHASKRHERTEKSQDSAFLSGDSNLIQDVRESISLAANSLAPVAILGESGTGKENIARAIHDRSTRKFGPFIAVDCGTLNEDLLESEFFGHLEGSFDGAHRQRAGLLSAATGGTLFLDEVSSLPAHFQHKLLLAFETRSFKPVGSRAEEVNDTRVIAASREKMSDLVEKDKLRSDLYYYLNVLQINLPALRNRPEDIGEICQTLIAQSHTTTSINLSESALKQLQEYPFPGNQKELENVLQRAMALCQDNQITEAELEFSPALAAEKAASNSINALDIQDLEAHLDEIEREIISKVLEAEKWNRTKSAKRLGLTPRQFRYKLSKYDLNDF